jgi:hypothetical protein
MSVLRPRVRIETLRSAKQNVTEWFERFELNSKRWSNEERGLEIACYFEDEAYEKFKLMEEETEEYLKVKSYMISKLKPADHKVRTKTEFYSAKQRPDEAIEKFGVRLLTCLKECDKKERAILELDLPDIFRRGCTASVRSVLAVKDKKTSFHSMWAKAREVECSLKEAELETTIKSVEESVDAVSKNVPNHCFKCKREGHIAKDSK